MAQAVSPQSHVVCNRPLQAVAHSSRTMAWFNRVFGFHEGQGYTQTQKQFEFSRERGELTSKGNGRTFICGRYVTPSLAELREWGSPNLKVAIEQLSKNEKTRICVKEVIGDVS